MIFAQGFMLAITCVTKMHSAQQSASRSVTTATTRCDSMPESSINDDPKRCALPWFTVKVSKGTNKLDWNVPDRTCVCPWNRRGFPKNNAVPFHRNYLGFNDSSLQKSVILYWTFRIFLCSLKMELPYAWPFLETHAPGLESRWIKTKICFVQWEIILSFEFNSGAQDYFHRNIS